MEKLSRLGASAVYYARVFGWAVFPVEGVFKMEDGRMRCTCPLGHRCEQMGKHPLGSLGKTPDGYSGLYHATTDIEQITKWWTDNPNANIGLRTGSKKSGGSGFFALDIDVGPTKDGLMDFFALTDDIGEIEDGPRSQTGSGGTHILMEYPEDSGLRISNKTGIIPPGKKKCDKLRHVDIRGENGYILAAPSAHKSGRTYEWFSEGRPDEHALPPAPQKLLEAISFDPTTKPMPSVMPEGDWEKDVAKRYKEALRYLNKMPGSISGQNGHVQLFKAVFSMMRGFVLPEDVVYEMILQEYNPRCLPPWSYEEVLHKIEQAQMNCDQEWAYILKNRETKAKEEREKVIDKTVGASGKQSSSLAIETRTNGAEGDPLLEDPLVRIPEFNFPFRTGSHAEIARGVTAYLERKGRILAFDEGEFVQYEPSKGIWQRISPELIRSLVARLDGSLIANGQKTLVMKSGLPAGVLSFINDEIKTREQWDFSQKPNGIAFKNGFVVIENGEFKITPHDPKNYAKFAHDFDFDPEAKHPKLDAFLAEVFDNLGDIEQAQLTQLLQEFLGSCLMGAAPIYQQCLVLYGPGGNGKSQFLDIARSIFPPNTTISLPPQRWGEPFRLAGLAGKLANFVDELPKAGITQSESFKSVVDGSEQDCNVKFRQPFIMRPIAGHMFACNELPLSDDQSFGFWRRPIVIPMTRDMTKAKGMIRNIGKAIGAEEKSGIIAWAIRGAAAAQARGGYVTPAVSRRAVMSWKNDSDTVLRFLIDPTNRDKLTMDAGWKARDMYGVFVEWLKPTGHVQLSETTFFRRVAASGLMQKWERRTGNFYAMKAEGLEDIEAEETRVADIERREREARTLAADEAIKASPPPPTPPPPPEEVQAMEAAPDEEGEIPDHVREDVPENAYDNVYYLEHLSRPVGDRQDELPHQVGDEVHLVERPRAESPTLRDGFLRAHTVQFLPREHRDQG